MKAILLAGGAGSRLFPATKHLSKQLLPVFDKPMIYYPLSLLMLAKIKDVLIIVTQEDKQSFVRLLGSGECLGMHIEYAVQETPNGIAKAFEIGEEFIGNDQVCLILGDNLFYGRSIQTLILNAKSVHSGATVFGYMVNDPERFGVVDFDEYSNVLSIEEKPVVPKSNIAVTGLYFYDHDVVNIVKKLKPSSRGEYEITSVNQAYLEQGRLKVVKLGSDVSWFDAGTHESLLDATLYVSAEQDRQKGVISCLEAIAFKNQWISKRDLLDIAKSYPASAYSQYLTKVALDEISVF